MSRKTIVIAGGGTGGHIYPGVAIARRLLQLEPEAEIHFVGSAAGLETKIIPKENFKLHLIDVGKLNYQGGLFAKIWTLLKIPKALLQSFSLLMDLKPNLVLGVGGYASGPFLLVSAVCGFNTAIWEANATPGLTNRWLARFVDRCYVVFTEAQKSLKNKNIHHLGLPVRQEIEDSLLNIKSQKQDGSQKSFNILVFGGSQGARAINEAIMQAVQKDSDWLNGVHLIHQTGRLDYERVKACYANLNKPVESLEYLFDMPKYYAWADLIICRAGASTVAEIAAIGKPAIFIPLPTAADDHQRKNAEVLSEAGAAILILQKDLTADRLIEKILELKAKPESLSDYADKSRQFHMPQAALKIAKDLANSI